MYAIVIPDNMIIREIRRMIHRNDDVMIVDLAIEPRFGTLLTEEMYRQQSLLTLQVNKSRYPELWTRVKDVPNDTLIGVVAEMLNVVLPVQIGYNADQVSPHTRLGIQETNLETGDLVTYYQDDDADAFEAARTRTGHEPQEIPQPNRFETALTVLKEKWPIDEFQNSLDHLIAMGITGDLTTEAI